MRDTSRADDMYAHVPDFVKEDLYEALVWARNTLTEHEGSGHQFNVLGDRDMMMYGNFAKPSWAGDHTGRPKETAAEAIVIAVCDYLNGV